MISVKNISFSYGRRQILHDVSFSLEPGTCTAVLGNNGAGKSTLISCINRILRPSAGSVEIDGRDLLKMPRNQAARCVACVAQKQEAGAITVFDAVLMGRVPYMKWGAASEDYRITGTVLAQTGLTELRLRSLDELSGGELQRVMLARAMVQEPVLLLLDEPTSNLDPKNQFEAMTMVCSWAKEYGRAVLISIHDLHLALGFCDHFLFLRCGTVLAFGGPEVVNHELLEQTYGIVLADTWHKVDVNGCRIIPEAVAVPAYKKCRGPA